MPSNLYCQNVLLLAMVKEDCGILKIITYGKFFFNISPENSDLKAVIVLYFIYLDGDHSTSLYMIV